jgi:hypothetical protein
MITETDVPRNALTIWVIYDHPADFPDSYVLRPQFVQPGGVMGIGDIAYTSNNIEALRKVMRGMGLHCLPRMPDDSSKIMETWL